MRDETNVRDKSEDVEEEEEDVLLEKNKESGALIANNTAAVLNGNAVISSNLDTVDVGVDIKHLKARWNTDLSDPVLDDINMSLKRQQLVAVIGPVGSGKSSLIQAILGELPAEEGTLEVHGSYSYASQEPWLFTGTVRENILFGLAMDRHRYRTVVKKCALDRDFELLPYGDQTIVGERGASLSGGQKARISLARAVYRKANIYLLDDPLSAVDTHVGRHLFDYCIRDYLKHKLVILVTHQLQFLEHADLIVVMDKGKVTMGTYEHMLNSGQDFTQLLAQSHENSNPDSEKETEKNSAAAGDYKRQESQQSKGSSKRLNSVSSVDSSLDSSLDISEKKEAHQVQEVRGGGQIGLGMYQKYFSSSGFVTFAIMLFLCIATQVMASGGDYFVSYWVKNNNQEDQTVDIWYFTAINGAIIILALLRTFLFFNVAMHSSTNLHNTMFRAVSRAALYFFHTNPSGRILNRFSMDLGQVDEVLPLVMIDCIQMFLTLAGIIMVLCVTNPWYLINTILMLLSFYYIREFYLNTSRNVKRLEAVARSPMYSHLGATLNGLSTVRALGAQKMLIAEYDNYQDLHSSGYYTFLSTSRAFGYYLDCFCIIYVVIIIVNNFITPPTSPGQIGLAITQAMSMTGMVQWGMRQSAELENSMTSVERVVEYKNLEPEGEFESPAGKQPPASWPESGEVVADELSLRYSPDPKTECVLKSLNFSIKAREKVGVVGRTGAGKSSLINALFRLSFNDGSVLIDKRDTEEMGLHDLRSKISIIPQEPVLFSGTMRYNLDPFEQYPDAKLWEALDEVHLKDAISELPTGLQSHISEGGSNFSVGQRQLVCLARAILRENRILVMDEATANVDPQTDALIQTTIRKKFKDCTVLTIAHRLHTVMDSDRIMVMDAGHVVEFDTPYELLTNSKNKVFYGMVMQTGKATFEHLLKMAQEAHEERTQQGRLE
ncbi:probable multidrug resistance-associated protein lethal(2)03659 isoform X2 [Scaptodrosophila lebanonensis]|nr:probable multidrug resistance-associated protein lethal(2)03659 isoform X2 [Scaptodrosophila lebanonensis]